MRFRWSVIIILAVLSLSGFAQSVYTLEIRSINDPLLLKKIEYKKSFFNKNDREKELQKVLLRCYDNAYLAASYDSVFSDSLTQTAYLNFDKQYKWAYLKHGNVDEGVLSEIGFRERLYSNKPVSFKDVKRVQEKLITYYENNGFPFASVRLDSLEIQDDKFSAQLHLQKNQEQKIDSIIINGNAKITPVYIYNYIGVKPGARYNESQLKKINNRIAELPFLRSTKPSTVLFSEKHNKLILNIEKKRASQFDGILGLLPDNKTGKILFTGDVRLKLQNGLGRGELIDLNWRKMQTQTQDLKLRLVYPFLFKTPFGLDYNFKLYKKDTTFIDVFQNIGVQYLFIGGNYFKVFYTNKTSNLLSTKGLEFITTLPAYADVQTNMYGIGFKFERLDYRLNPRKGFYLLMNASAGTKNIKRNAKVNQEVYDKITLNSTQYNGELEAILFIPLGGRSTVKVSDQSGFVNGENTFQNELLRIGGLKTLRGFDEESIFTSAYSIFTLEYRFLLEQNSYLYLFGDGAWYENNNVQQYVTDTPIGFGAGISFETKAGIFSINYALGKQFNNPIQLRSGKIHFGIVNYF
ncbi:MAG: hypothetical protein JNL24_08850 [Bacteroidia bacterium]|nr:hypothetical protein [Bacteroidia bacterium]